LRRSTISRGSRSAVSSPPTKVRRPRRQICASSSPSASKMEKWGASLSLTIPTSG
jgi:hypothetical protein